jgi:hypothetical protein
MADKRGYAVLVIWGESHQSHKEVVRGVRRDAAGGWQPVGLTMAEAEQVAREARRLGAELASVHTIGAALLLRS